MNRSSLPPPTSSPDTASATSTGFVADVTVVGGGLAGCEAAWQLARRGMRVSLVEMKPSRMSPAHGTPLLAELVCSNSLRSDDAATPAGLLKAELRGAGSLIIDCADRTRVPAGEALAVDRHAFSRLVTTRIALEPNIRLERRALDALPLAADHPVIIAGGPLVGAGLARDIRRLAGDRFYFYDAIAPIIEADSIDWEHAFRASRYGKSTDKGQRTDQGQRSDTPREPLPYDRPRRKKGSRARRQAERLAAPGPDLSGELNTMEVLRAIPVGASRSEDTAAAVDAVSDAVNGPVREEGGGAPHDEASGGEVAVEGDYINCPLTEEEYHRFVDELRRGRKVLPHTFEEPRYFDGCLPIEVMAERGEEVLAFGPMKPVGLRDPRHPERRFHAVVQLRAENRYGTSYNLVGFQTRLAYPEQKRIFSLIPALRNAEFLRFGSIHRNSYIESHRLLDEELRLRARPEVRFAGQITGVEGYIESTAIGLLAALFVAARAQGRPAPLPPPESALGGLLHHVTHPRLAGERFQPTNINFGLLPPLPERARKRDRRTLHAERARRAIERWLQDLALAEDLPSLRMAGS